MTVRFETVGVGGLKVLYRSAGDPGAPAVLLRHRLPSASHMFRDLISELAGKYHVAASDLPGFGMTEQPARDAFACTFQHRQGGHPLHRGARPGTVRHLCVRLRHPGRPPADVTNG